MVAAMDRPARMPALGAATCGCVQSHRDDAVIVVSFDEMRNAALGDGEGTVHASHDGRADQDHQRPEAIHRHPRKVSKTTETGQFQFTMTGPGSPSVLTNMPVAIEQHAEWIADCIGHLRERGLGRIEAKPDAAESWGTEVDRAASATLLPMASSSWYFGANVPGKPQVFMPYAGGMVHYRGLCERVVAEGYDGFVLS